MNDAFYTSYFYRGWRPMLGWVSVTATGIQFIVFPILTAIFDGIKAPEVSVVPLITLVLAQVGIRTVEKINKDI